MNIDKELDAGKIRLARAEVINAEKEIKRKNNEVTRRNLKITVIELQKVSLHFKKRWEK